MRGSAVVLAVPFLIGIAALHGLTVEIETYHVSDASAFHVPTILQFADELPAVDFEHYPAAQTPLFHLLMAIWVKVVGFEAWQLRLLNVAISYVALLVLYRWLVDGFSFERRQALAFTLLFGLSPYVLGPSFAVLTDNLGILFGILALERFHRSARQHSLGQFALGCAAMSAAILTRQAFLFLAPVAAWALLSMRPEFRRLAAGVSFGALSIAPLAVLVVVWGGLVPKGADAASCGLCDDPSGAAGDRVSLRGLGFTVTMFGLYAGAIYAPALLRRARELRLPPARTLLPPLAAGLALVVVSDLVRHPSSFVNADGYLWQASEWIPAVASSSLLFWALVPLGTVAIWLLVERAGLLSLPAVYLVAFLASTLVVRLIYQKYFDPFALLALVMLMRPDDLRVRTDYAGVAALGIAFVAFALRPYA